MSHIAIYPGTFDPITLGHIDIIKRAAKIFDEVIVAVAIDSTKKTIFTVEERIAMVQAEVQNIGLANVVCETFHGLLVDFVVTKNAAIVVRGLRALSDFEYEFQMSYMNNKLRPEVETVFLPATENSHFISSSFVKEVARLNGDVSALVSEHVAQMLYRLYSNA
jgi:pantetheine-phosphate adenylyltransferase